MRRDDDDNVDDDDTRVGYERKFPGRKDRNIIINIKRDCKSKFTAIVRRKFIEIVTVAIEKYLRSINLY